MILNEILEKRNYDYNSLFNNEKIIKNIKNKKSDINVIIGVRKRKSYLNSSLKYLLKSINEYNYNISITVVEIDNKPENIDICNDVNYIFVPIGVINTYTLYSRALAFNIGYKFIPESKYYLFHDCDILVPTNFFNILFDYYINEDFKWLQTFTNKRLVMLQDISSSKILNGEMLELNKITDFRLAQPGAAGGSTLVERNTFESVGGFDPEIFYGYAPEDSLFFTKLCCLERHIDSINSCHQCDDIHYADNPPIELYHINHPLTLNENPFFKRMEQYHNYFWSLIYEEKLNYIELKKKLFKNNF